MKFTQIFSAIALLFTYVTAVAISKGEVKLDTVKRSAPVVDASNGDLVSGLETIIPTIASIIFNALGESPDKFATVIPGVLSNLNLTSVNPQPLILAAESNSTATPSGGSGDPAFGFVANIVSEIFRILGVSTSTIISNLPGIISAIIKIFQLTIPDIIHLITGLLTGNPLSILNIIKIAGDVVQDLGLGFQEAITVIQQIISNLS
ncbi:unnamed protein product [Candida verbasci]|uniref:Uncharacterized protein n=1 Tax=Candida verbasci TaxID=1227364 RepID=A0A9W4TY60_9ASCO|nr:unnamed protein product [Candida verbasci]